MTDPTQPAQEISEVVVQGRRIRFEYTTPAWVQPLAPPGEHIVREPGDPLEPIRCLPTEGMTDAQKLRALIDFAAAVWRSEVLQATVQNMEYAAAVYISPSGELKVTGFRGSGTQAGTIGWADMPTFGGSGPDLGLVVAIIHSHPRYNLGPSGPNHDYFDTSDPARLLRPSLPYVDFTGALQAGDWAIYDWVRNGAIGQQASGGAGPHPELSLIIVVWNGTSLGLNRYGAADYGYGSLDYAVSSTGGASDGQPGARGMIPTRPLPPCSD
jgi:hypothetical protein